MKRSDLIDVIERVHDAARAVIDNWDKGDLAGAVRDLEAADIEFAKPALEWWASDE